MTSVAVDPAILRVVGDVGRPERGYDDLPDTQHIPGKDGLFAGLANLWGWMRHGHAHLQMQAEKHGPLYRGQLGTDRVVFVSDPRLAGEVLRNRDRAWLENITVELSAEECEAILAALPVRTRCGHPVRALFTVMWETSLRIGTLRRLKVPEHYTKGADSLRITHDIDKARYARRIPLTLLAHRDDDERRISRY